MKPSAWIMYNAMIAEYQRRGYDPDMMLGLARVLPNIHFVSCCGKCVHWHTYLECGGEKYGWWGYCSNVGEIEADDWCRHFEEEKQAEVNDDEDSV